MEKIFFDETTYIWKTKLNLVNDKQAFLKEANSIIESMSDNKTDGFAYKREGNTNLTFIGNIKVETKLDEIVQLSINKCKNLYGEKNINYNKINTDAWINVVRAKNPIQKEFIYTEIKDIDRFHSHVEINKKTKKFRPEYTYVYYIQMPDVMDGEDGVLYLKGKNDIEYWIRPEEDDLIIMNANLPHAPNNAPQSTIDRIVMAGNVGFDYIKKEKSLL